MKKCMARPQRPNAMIFCELPEAHAGVHQSMAHEWDLDGTGYREVDWTLRRKTVGEIGPRPGEMKIGYRRSDNSESVAYVDEETGIGTDKYTEDTVRVRWDGNAWVEERGVWITRMVSATTNAEYRLMAEDEQIEFLRGLVADAIGNYVDLDRYEAALDDALEWIKEFKDPLADEVAKAEAWEAGRVAGWVSNKVEDDNPYREVRADE